MGLNLGGIVASGSLSNGETSPGQAMGGPFLFSLSGTWTGTVELVCSLDSGSTFLNVALPDGTANAFIANGLYAAPNAPHSLNPRYALRATLSSGSVSWSMVS